MRTATAAILAVPLALASLLAGAEEGAMPDRIRFVASGRVKAVQIRSVTAARITYIDEDGATYATSPEKVEIVLWHGVTDASVLLGEARALAAEGAADADGLRLASAVLKYNQAVDRARAIRPEAPLEYEAARVLIGGLTARRDEIKRMIEGQAVVNAASQDVAAGDSALAAGHFREALAAYTRAREALAGVTVDTESPAWALIQRTKARVETNWKALADHRDVVDAVAALGPGVTPDARYESLERASRAIAPARQALDALHTQDVAAAAVFAEGRAGFDKRAAEIRDCVTRHADAQRALVEARRILTQIEPLVGEGRASEAMAQTAAAILALRPMDRVPVMPAQREAADRLRERAAAEVKRLEPLVDMERAMAREGAAILAAEADLKAIRAVAAAGQMTDALRAVAALRSRVEAIPVPRHAGVAQRRTELVQSVDSLRADLDAALRSTNAEQVLAEAAGSADRADKALNDGRLDEARVALQAARRGLDRIPQTGAPDLNDRVDALRRRVAILDEQIAVVAARNAVEKAIRTAEALLVEAEALMAQDNLAAADDPLARAMRALEDAKGAGDRITGSELAARLAALAERCGGLGGDLTARKEAAGWVRLDPGGTLRRPTPVALWEAFLRAFDAGRFEEAEALITRLSALPRAPVTGTEMREAHAVLWCRWAEALAARDRRPEARALYRRVIDEFADTPSAEEARRALEGVPAEPVGQAPPWLAPAAVVVLLVTGFIVGLVAHSVRRSRRRGRPRGRR